MLKQPEEPMVLRDAPEAASLQTVTGWVSRLGRFYGNDEALARYDGCTHVRCRHCQAPVKKPYTACDPCIEKSNTEKYLAMPQAKWDGSAMLYSDSLSKYYSSIDEADDDLEDGQSLEDLRLIICVPNYPRQIDEDHFADQLDPDDEGSLPDLIADAMKAFNEAITNARPLSWSPGKFALDLS